MQVTTLKSRHICVTAPDIHKKNPQKNLSLTKNLSQPPTHTWINQLSGVCIRDAAILTSQAG